MAKVLSQQKKLFVQAYSGPDYLEEAMQIAGVQGAPAYLRQKGNEWLKDDLVVKGIAARDDFKVRHKKAVATREERQHFWTEIMKNNDPYGKPRMGKDGPKEPEDVTLAHRLKASELLGKSEADFIDKLQVEHKVTITDLIEQSYSDENVIEGEAVEIVEEKKELKAALPSGQTIDDLV